MRIQVDIPFNKPYVSGRELEYIQEAINTGQISGNGLFTKKCHKFLEEKYYIKKVLLTTSCTDALEMSSMLIGIKPGDEVIVPSFTFVSTALAFIRQGAKIIFCDSRSDHPGIDEDQIEELITERTKAIVPVHYAGMPCNMEKIMAVADKYNLWVIEDAAMALDSYYNNKPVGCIGHLGCFSFHETKNIQCGEGGFLAINSKKISKRAEIIWEKGTNRAQFFRGEINKYNWIDTGSSFLPSELNAAFLFAQLENINIIQKKRKHIWDRYYTGLKSLADQGLFRLPENLKDKSINVHMFYIICRNRKERDTLIIHLRENNIRAVFHYLCLHKSQYYKKTQDTNIRLPLAEWYEKTIIRLPFYYELNDEKVDIVLDKIYSFYLKKT